MEEAWRRKTTVIPVIVASRILTVFIQNADIATLADCFKRIFGYSIDLDFRFDQSEFTCRSLLFKCSPLADECTYILLTRQSNT